MAAWQGEFEIASWDEKPYEEMEGGRKLTRATVAQKFTGDLAGPGSVEWLMCYADDGTARFVGYQRIESEVEGRRGGLVVETVGDFDGSKAVGTWVVVPGSGTGQLSDIEGQGHFEAPVGGKPTYRLNAQTP